MKPEVGSTYVITTDNWFVAPDGNQYKAVFGTVHGIYNDEETLRIKTNRGSANWYVSIGNMTIAGCQIHYMIRSSCYNTNHAVRDIEYEGKIVRGYENAPRIFNADLN